MALKSIHVEVDEIDRDSWSRLITQFSDATLYQTWSYGSVGRRPVDVRHIVLKAGEEIVGCCQVTIQRVLPLFGVGIADIKWGPLWRRNGRTAEPNILLQSIQHLKREYGIKRRLLLRIRPHTVGREKELARHILETEGFKRNPTATPYRTLRLDLSPSLEELRKNLIQKWRNHLNKAEKNGLSLIEGTTDGLYKTFLLLAKEMRERKGFVPGVDYDAYRRIQADLPEPLKMRIVTCQANGEPICVSIYSAIGDTGIYLLGATADKGMGLNGSYLLQWHIVRQLKESGIRYYDLGGVDPVGNPGVYEFKLGLAGRNGCQEELLGEFHGCFEFQGKLTRAALKARSVLRGKAHRSKAD